MSSALESELELRLKGATRLALLTVGSELRSDDAAGLLVGRALEREFPRHSGFLVVEGCSAPENLTGPLVDFEPSHIVVVDCAELGAPPGSVRLFPVESIGGLSPSTHTLPLGIVLGYLRSRLSCEILVIGIQPSSLDFDGEPSKAALDAARSVTLALAGIVRSMGERNPPLAGRTLARGAGMP